MPLREYDRQLERIRRAAPSVEASKLASTSNDATHLPFLSRKATGARSTITERLRANGLSIAGSLDAIAHRHSEFVLKWNANVDSGVPVSQQTIVTAVEKEEYELRESERAGRSRPSSSFFALKKKRKKEDDKLKEGNDYIAQEGDSFDILIRKMKALRQRKRQRLSDREENEGSQDPENSRELQKHAEDAENEKGAIPTPQRGAQGSDQTELALLSIQTSICPIDVPSKAPLVPPPVSSNIAPIPNEATQSPTKLVPGPASQITPQRPRPDNAHIQSTSPVSRKQSQSPNDLRIPFQSYSQQQYASQVQLSQPTQSNFRSISPAGNTAGDQPLTKEQLERMERNRLIAIKRQKLWRDRQIQKVQNMRQPNL